MTSPTPAAHTLQSAAWRGHASAWLLASLLIAMLWPALHAVGGTLHTMWQGTPLAGGGSLWPGPRVTILLGQGLLLSLLSAAVATAVGAVCAAALMLPLAPASRWLIVAGLAASFCFGTVVHLLAWRGVFPVVTGGLPGWALATVALGLRFAPLAAALLVTGLASFERAELETALGSGGSHALWAVARTRLLRLAGMCMAAVGALVFCESELPPLVGVHVYAEEFLSQVALEPDPHVAAALGWPLMALALVCAAVLSRLPRLRPGAAGAVQMGWVGHWVHAPAIVRVLLPAVAITLVSLPLVLLAWGSLQASGRWPAHAGAALWSSLWVATVSALLACGLGWALAGLAVLCGGVWRSSVSALAWLAMLWPSALTGLAIASAGLPAAMGSATPLVLAHTMRLLPFAVWVMLAQQDAQSPGPAEQLRTLGGRGWAAWRHVRLPAAIPGLLAAFVLGFGLSLAELTATVLTVPPGMETVVLRLYNLLHYGDQLGVMLMALLQGLTVAAAVVLALALPRRWWDQPGNAHAHA